MTEKTPIEHMFTPENYSRLYTLSMYLRTIDYNKKVFQTVTSLCRPSSFDPNVNILKMTAVIDAGRKNSRQWNEFFENLKNYLLELEKKGEVLIIGNGGAGLSGMIEFAATYHDEYLFIWSADHSLPNFKFHKTLHAAITYEPNIEMYMTEKKKIHKPKNIFVNSFHMVCPEEDFLEIKPIINEIVDACDKMKGTTIQTSIENEFVFISENEKTLNYRKIVGFAFIYSFFKTLYNKVYMQECKTGECIKKWKQCFATRYNHSAMGENDKLAFVLGCTALITFIHDGTIRTMIDIPILKWEIEWKNFLQFMLIPQPYDKSNYSVLLDRMMDVWESTCMIRNPIWFPPNVLNYALDNNVYHINDTTFIHQKVIRLHSDLEIQNSQTFWADNKLILKEKNTRKKIEFNLDHLTDAEFKQFINTKTFESIGAFKRWIANIPEKHTFEYLKIIKGGSGGEYKTLKTHSVIPPERVVVKAPMPNFAQMWSPMNLPKTYKQEYIKNLFDKSFIESFNKIKCFNTSSSICMPFEDSKSTTFVQNSYLKDFKMALDHLGKYYLIEWAFGQYESMDDFIAEVTHDGNSQTNLKIKTCLDINNEPTPCYKKMTEKYFDKCFDGNDQISCVNTTINTSKSTRSEDTLIKLFHHYH